MKQTAFFIAIIFALLKNGISFPSSCPAAENISPCRCINGPDGFYVVCAGLKDTHILANALKYLRNYKINYLALERLVLKEDLPTNLFHDMKINEIVIERSNLTLAQPAFKGLDESIRTLNIIHHSPLKNNEKFAIASLSNLEELNIKETFIGSVEDNWINGKMLKAKKIRLENDGISKIESSAFADLSLLQTISLGDNKIKDVKRSMFPMPAKNLETVDLSDNQIQHLPEDFFSGMPILKEVVMSGNNLSTLSEITWKPVWVQLKRVYIFDNSLICDSSLNWMSKLEWPELLEAECSSPSSLVGKNLIEVYNI